MRPEKEPILEKADVERIIGQPVSDFTIASGANKGDNVAGNLLAIKVETKSGEKMDLVYKSFPGDADPEQKQYVIEFGIFRIETCMYEKIFPRIQELIDSRKYNGEPIKLSIPKFISGFNDDENDYICLEDVRHQGFIMQNKLDSLTVGEVSLVMKEVAKFHALTYFLMRYDGERLFEEDDRIKRIKYNCLTVENPVMATMFSRMFKGYFENAVELLEPRDKELADHIRKFNEKSDHHRLHDLQRFNHKRTDKSIFACIVHGDLWTNNILFKYAKEGNRDEPTELKFIDFQLSRRGNIFEDLGYFFWTSTTPAFRKLHLINMLNVYFKSFEDILEKQLQCPMPIGFTMGSLVDGFHKGILTAYIYMPFALSLQMGDLSKNAEKKPKDGEDQGDIKTNEVNGAQKHPPVFDFEKIIESNKKTHKLRMLHSPAALERLEDLTREIVEMNLLQ